MPRHVKRGWVGGTGRLTSLTFEFNEILGRAPRIGEKPKKIGSGEGVHVTWFYGASPSTSNRGWLDRSEASSGGGEWPGHCSWEGLSHAPAPAAWSPSPRQQPDARSVAEGVQGDHFVGLLFAARAPISRPHPLCILTVKQLDQKKVRRGASVLTHSRRRIT